MPETATTALAKLWTIEEVAAYLDLHPQTIRRKVADGTIGSIKRGVRRYIPDAALAAYVNGN